MTLLCLSTLPLRSNGYRGDGWRSGHRLGRLLGRITAAAAGKSPAQDHQHRNQDRDRKATQKPTPADGVPGPPGSAAVGCRWSDRTTWRIFPALHIRRSGNTGRGPALRHDHREPKRTHRRGRQADPCPSVVHHDHREPKRSHDRDGQGHTCPTGRPSSVAAGCGSSDRPAPSACPGLHIERSCKPLQRLGARRLTFFDACEVGLARVDYRGQVLLAEPQPGAADSDQPPEDLPLPPA